MPNRQDRDRNTLEGKVYSADRKEGRKEKRQEKKNKSKGLERNSS